jgi:hypothetical protein
MQTKQIAGSEGEFDTKMKECNHLNAAKVNRIQPDVEKGAVPNFAFADAPSDRLDYLHIRYNDRSDCSDLNLRSEDPELNRSQHQVPVTRVVCVGG